MATFDEEIKTVWNQHAKHYDKKHNQREDRDIWKQILVEHIGKDKNQRVLDMGTGTGFLAHLAAEAGYRSVGIDFAENMVAQAKEIANETNLDIDFIQGDWNELPFENDSIDVIVNRLIMWTVFTPEETLREWWRVLKPGGRILCFCPEDTKERMPSHYTEAIEKLLPLRNANSVQFAQTLKTTGYQQISITELPELCGDKLFRHWALIKGEKEIMSSTN